MTNLQLLFKDCTGITFLRLTNETSLLILLLIYAYAMMSNYLKETEIQQKKKM